MSIKRAAARDQIKDLLLERILNGTYKPGDRLVELQIAEELNTSQAPVREAFRYLEAMKVVVTEPYKGTRVRSVSDRELKESSQVRAALEQLAAELAAPKFGGDVRELENEARRFMAAARKRDFAAYAEHDMAFHRLIVEASGNEILCSTWESIVLELRFRKTLDKIGEGKLVEFGSAHLPVIDRLKDGDGRGAGKALKSLICKYHGLDRAREEL
ncbi:MAG: GntR family transcriptional regulator [Candidatus Obscuribacterales bacterium]|nr:GntR family transcriptional regulator [Candidatus Obscuribacterales bacterium]